MFARWKKRKSASNQIILDAVLVESKREGGKVKQKYIKHLGSIEEKPDRLSAIYFWFSFQKNLKGLKLTDSKKNEITAKVAGRIPKVTDREFYQLQSFCRSGEHPEKEKDSFKRLIKRHLPRFSVW